MKSKRNVMIWLGSPAGTVYDFYLDGKHIWAMSGTKETSPGFHRVCVKDADNKGIFNEMVNFDDNVSLTVRIVNGIPELDVKCI